MGNILKVIGVIFYVLLWYLLSYWRIWCGGRL